MPGIEIEIHRVEKLKFTHKLIDFVPKKKPVMVRKRIQTQIKEPVDEIGIQTQPQGRSKSMQTLEFPKDTQEIAIETEVPYKEIEKIEGIEILAEKPESLSSETPSEEPLPPDPPVQENRVMDIYIPAIPKPKPPTPRLPTPPPPVIIYKPPPASPKPPTPVRPPTPPPPTPPPPPKPPVQR